MEARRQETDAERSDRNWAELVQELRVAQTGVQVLAGFLLTLPFTATFFDIGARARAHPELVQLVPFRHADHIGSWNADPTRYDHAMVAFLRAHVPVADRNAP